MLVFVLKKIAKKKTNIVFIFVFIYYLYIHTYLFALSFP